MICKYCNAQIDDAADVCPVCGMALAETAEVTAEETPVAEAAAEETVVTAEEAVETADETTEETAEEAVETADETTEEIAEASEEKAEKKPAQRKVLPIVLWTLASVVALGVLAVVLLAALGVEVKLPKNDITRKESYTVSDEKAVKKGDDVVAKVDGKKLTNSMLQIYYRMQVLEFVNYYSSTLSQIGFDYTQPLSSQMSYFDNTITWEQYFIDVAIDAWSVCQALCLEAEENGFELDAATVEEIAKIPEALEQEAADGQYESADAMVKAILGPVCTVEDYAEYVRMDTIANAYYSKLYAELQPTDEDVEEYFVENEEILAENGITKDCGLISSVRHILVCPKMEEGSEEETYTEQQWADCKAKADSILEEWKAGEATEESFAALVPVYTEDPGSIETGGLYEQIDPSSSYVENFLAWSVDMVRQPGDTDIIQTEYGYHIMYFVEGSPYWKEAVKATLLSELVNNMRNGIITSHPSTVTYKNIAISNFEL